MTQLCFFVQSIKMKIFLEERIPLNPAFSKWRRIEKLPFVYDVYVTLRAYTTIIVVELLIC